MLAGVAAISVTPPETAFAQDGDIVLDEIVTTARKREESLQKVPVAVSAFDTDAIVERGLRDISDIGRFAPGLSFAKAFGRATDRPVIRGQGNVLAGVQFGVESGAAYFIDGVYYPGDLSSIDLSNLERVEVIRGPQAALYGRNTYSGAINFVTRSPSDSRGGYVKARYGSDADTEIVATLGGPFSDTVAGEITARYYSFDGEYTNAVTGRTVGEEETTSVSGRIVLTPNETFTLDARLSYQEDEDGTRPFFLQPSESNNCFSGTRSNASWLWTGSSNNNQFYCGEVNRPGDSVALNDGPANTTIVVPGIPDTPLPGFDIPGVFPPGLFPGGDPYNTGTGVAFSGVDREIFLASLKASLDFGSGYSLVGSFASRTEDRSTGSDSDHSSINYIYNAFFPAPPETVECTFCASSIDEYEDYSFEVRLESPADRRLRWMLGAFYYDQEQETFDILFNGTSPAELEQTVENTAVFGSLDYDLTDAVTATLELRWFDEEKGRTELDVAPVASFKSGDEEVAPRFSLNWAVNDDTIVYGIYAKGYKPGGVIGSDGATLLPPTTTYEQEESDTWEIGQKSVLMDGRMVFNASVFFIDAENIQLTTPLASGGSGALTSVVTNQGSGETFGVEIEARYAANEYLTVGGTWAMADSEFTEGCDDFQWTLTSGGGVLQDADICTGSSPNGQGSGSISGNQYPLSSKYQFSAYGDVRWPTAGGREFFANLSWSWEDKKPVQVHNLAWVPEASIVDLRIGLESDTWSIAGYARNLMDEDAPSMVTRWLQDPLLSIYASGVFGSMVDPTNAGAPAGYCGPNPCSTNFPRAFFGDMRRGRNVGIEVTYNFGN